MEAGASQGEADVLHTVRINPRADGSKGVQVRQRQQSPGALSTRVTPPAHNIRVKTARMNQFATTNRTLQTQSCSKPPPRKAPRSQVFLHASPLAVSHAASPKILQAQLRLHLLWGTSGPWARLTSSLHPHIHRSGRAAEERAGLECANL